MSPLAALLSEAHRPVAILAALVVDSWALWFTLGRGGRPTLLLALAANGASFAATALVLVSGALGPGARPFGLASGTLPQASPLAWTLAWLCALGAFYGLEVLVLRQLMRRSRPSFQWDRYDLAVYFAANAFSLGITALDLWWESR